MQEYCIKTLSNIWFGYLLESPHWGDFNKYPKHMFQGSGNSEIWIGPDDDVINEPISKKNISLVMKTNDNWQSYNSF